MNNSKRVTLGGTGGILITISAVTVLVKSKASSEEKYKMGTSRVENNCIIMIDSTISGGQIYKMSIPGRMNHGRKKYSISDIPSSKFTVMKYLPTQKLKHNLT